MLGLRTRENSMSERVIVKSLFLAGTAAFLSSAPALAQTTGSLDLSSDNTGWVSIGTDYVATPTGPQPVTFDKAHPYVPNGSGTQPTFRVADVDNANLTDFAKTEIKKSNDMV